MFYSAAEHGFYDPAIHGDNIPADAVEISREQYAALMASQALGKTIAPDAAGYPVAVEPAGPDIAEMRERALAQVRTAAAAARDAWRTPGKDGVYLSKLAEADAWEAAGHPDDLTAYPYLSGEVGITRDTPAELVDLWRAMAAAWATAAARIERQEMAAKRDIQAAGTAAEIEAVLAGLEWPQPPA